jgi:uncharacterized phage protein gp47/JayE
MITLGQLLTPTTEDEALKLGLEYLSSFGFQATSWQSGSIQHSMVRFFSRLYSDLTIGISDAAASGWAKKSRGVYLDLLGEYDRDLIRQAAIATVGNMILTSTAAAPVHTWGVEEIVIADAPTAPANTWRITLGGTLNPGTSVTVSVKAETAGSAANIGANSTLYLWTPLVGVTVTNPANDLSTTWITTSGQDRESDTRYIERLIGRWHRLSLGTLDSYKAWVLEADPTITRVIAVTNSSLVAGGVRLICATATGGISAAQITTVSNYLNGVTDGKQRRLLNDSLSIESATLVATPALDLAVTCDSALSSDVAARVTKALNDMLALLPIGGEIVAPNITGRIFASKLYGTTMGQAGVRNVTGITGDFPLQPTDIYVPTIAITVIPN